MMTAGGLPPSKQESTIKDIEKGGDLTEEIAGKDSQVLHETRSQKQVSKKRLHEDHAEILTKDSSITVTSETTNSSVGVSTRSSTRPNKRKKLSVPQSNKVGNQENSAGCELVTSSSSSSPQTNRRKKQPKRQWESWGKAEKDTFFEALHEYGKDFDKICNFIAAKHKRRGDPPALIKNKDQVRHFYYRSLNKINKYLPAEYQRGSDTQQKMIIELKGLICYGELRKKICGWNDKHGKKLEELLNHGTISIRSKGRNFKVKAPVCRALKRLQSVGRGKEDGDAQPLAMPNKFVLELMPHDHLAWAAVQQLSKNPRLRMSVPAKKPLSGMLNFLMKKWQILSRKTLEPLQMCIVVPPEINVLADVTEKQTNSPVSKTSSDGPGLVENSVNGDVIPAEDLTKLCSPSFSLEEKSSDVILNGHLESSTNDMAWNGCNNLPSEPNTPGGGCAENSSQTDKTVDTLIGMKGSSQGFAEAAWEPCFISEPVEHDKVETCSNKNCPSLWTLNTCGNITFGEIYCKLRRPPKLKLEYTWNGIEHNLAPSHTAISLPRLVDIATTEFTKVKESNDESKATSKSSDTSASKNISCSLSKDKGTTLSVSKEKVSSKFTRPATKINDKLPFILPSVVAPATQTSTSRSTISDLSLQTRPMARVRKRPQRPNIHRTLLPRPVGSLSSVPPGAVAVSFIPQPGQTVGTILASGVPTTTSSGTTQSKTVVSSRSPPVGTSSSSTLATVSSLVERPSPSLPVVGVAAAENGFTNANPTDLSLEMSGFSDTDLLAVVDHFVGSTKSIPDSVVATSNSVDSIIGLALGTALDDGATPTSIAGMSEDSNSALLASLTALKTSNLDQAAQTVQRIGSDASSNVHIEELNSGVAGGSMSSTVTSPTLENILNSTNSVAQSPTSCNVFFNSAGPICSIADSQSQQEALIDKESISVSSLMLSPNSESSLPASFQTHWFNGENSNFSIGSLLDKMSTSPKKDERLHGLGESGESACKEPSQEILPSAHHLLDPETAFHAIMDENSVDFVKKFQDLAKEISGENNKAPTSPASDTVFASSCNTELNGRSSDDSNSDNGIFKHILKQTKANFS
ncbi:uncharacterized protein LOC111327389 isoform X2 [Stylophora pistillata]|uniref:Protein cramped-like n=1 Tax=Stylophora pistillata TaxID=50429 RepID=A0A2B4T0P4_STYPI|nr:uncharacterized protein LOC111327389 isoform X2 [Stylophora pistillata]PFX34237.1 Protein cramped-like [Stylophora pistillata]